MHYYSKHIGDYTTDTAHLSMLEHGAYTLLLDRYYTTEQPIPKNQAYRLARARSKEEQDAVDIVLQEFFVDDGEAWRHARCDAEIEDYQAKATNNRKNGKKGGRPKKTETQTEPTKNPDGFETQTQKEPRKNPCGFEDKTQTELNSNPNITLTNNHKPITNINTLPKGNVQKPDKQVVAKPAAPPVNLCPHDSIIELYHECLPALPRIRDWTPARQQALRARWREKPERQNLDWWRKFFGYVAQSDFLTGKVTSNGRRPFAASLDWLCKAENFAKVIEGRYENDPTEEVAHG